MSGHLGKPQDGRSSRSTPGCTRLSGDAGQPVGRRDNHTGPRQVDLGGTGHRIAGSMRAVAGSQLAGWVAGVVLAAAAVGQAWREDLLSVPLGVAVVLATLPLAYHRSFPAVAGYLMAVGASSYAIIDYLEQRRLELEVIHAAPDAQPAMQPEALLAPLAGGLVGLYLLVRNDKLRVRWLVLVATAVLLTNVFGTRNDLAGLALFSIVLWIVALDSAQSRAELHRERAAALARSIADQRRQAVASERAEIARELHDLVAHSVSVIAVQAELLPPTIPELPGPARAGFEQIARSARSAMTELRQMLDVLRQEPTAAELAPLPTLGQLPELIDQHRAAAGGSVALRTYGQVRWLPPLVELSAYRVVQEALTNTRKHAPGADAQVDISYEPDTLAVQITDDGPVTSTTDPTETTVGHGLVGMNERVSMLGGRLRTRHLLSGGFEVTAELPIPPPASVLSQQHSEMNG